MSIKTTFKAKTVDNLSGIAKEIIKNAGNERIFSFYGRMGAGKTTLIKSFVKQLKSDDEVNSPTFSLVNEYETKENEYIYHFDFYRIEKLEELYDIGFEEYLYSGNYCLMEWPEKISDLLPKSYIKINIKEVENNERLITYELIQ